MDQDTHTLSLQVANDSYSIESWIERVPRGSLKGTRYGHDQAQTPHPGLHEDPRLRQIYLMDMAMFISTEKVSAQGISGIMKYAPDDATMVFLATQTLDETRHYEAFCRRMRDMGVSVEEQKQFTDYVTTTALAKFHCLIRELVDKGDFLGALVAHNIILEGMAYPVYRYEMKYWSKIDPALVQIIRGAFADEVSHVRFGERYIQAMIEIEPQARDRVCRLTREFSMLMAEIFQAVITEFVGLYQEAIRPYMALVGDIELFPGKRMAEISEEEQVRILLNDIREEHKRRMERIGISA